MYESKGGFEDSVVSSRSSLSRGQLAFFIMYAISRENPPTASESKGQFGNKSKCVEYLEEWLDRRKAYFEPESD